MSVFVLVLVVESVLISVSGFAFESVFDCVSLLELASVLGFVESMLVLVLLLDSVLVLVVLVLVFVFFMWLLMIFLVHDYLRLKLGRT